MAPLPETRDREDRVAAEMPKDAGSQALSEALRSSFGIVKVLMVLLVLVFIASGIFQVGPQERAILLRFGKPVGTGERALYGPGLHLALPYPIDESVKVSITGLQKTTSTVGWFAVTQEQEMAGAEPYPAASLNPAVDGYALTADGNIIHTRATLSYRIEDPVRYVFGFVNASNAVQNALNNALLSTASRFSVDDILTRDIAGYRDAVRRSVTQLVESQKLGVVVEQCDVESRPPLHLKEQFANVLKAEIGRNKLLNQARSDESQILSKAAANAQARVNLAESERARLVAEVSSRAEQFEELLPQYSQNPGLFVQQRLSDSLSRSMTNVQDKIFLPESLGGKTTELRLMLNREPLKLKTNTVSR
jgi:modulator of FtsH protease HflK